MASLKEIAGKAGVSAWTVSRVLAGRAAESRIGAACAARVREAAEQMGYVHNYHAQSLRRGRSGTIGAAESYPKPREAEHTSFWWPLLGSIEAAIRQSEHDLLLVGEAAGQSAVARGVAHLKSSRIDALIVPCMGYVDLAAAEQADRGPIVLAMPRQASRWPSVGLDAAPGLRAAVRHLVELGHRRLLWLGPTHTPDRTAEKRLSVLRQAVAEAGVSLRIADCLLPAAVGESFAATSLHARACLRERLGHDDHETAVICFNDALAVGACQAVHDGGGRVPQDLSVVGFDDVFTDLFAPGLTTISHMLPRIGTRAAELALAVADGQAEADALAGHAELVPAELIVRETTGAPRA